MIDALNLYELEKLAKEKLPQGPGNDSLRFVVLYNFPGPGSTL
jgi:hypothetical protein